MPPNLSAMASTSLMIDAPYTLSPSSRSSLPTSLSNNLFRESERLRTFTGWPLTFLSPEVMAKSGFYYLKKDDFVRCPFCGIQINQWERNDDPMEDHKKWSRECTFVNNPGGCGNISIEQESSNPSPLDSNVCVGHDTCGPCGIEGVDFTKDTVETLGIPKIKKPSFPQYAVYENRKLTFQAWPVSLKIKPNALCDAGFFYTGKGDQTICFFCGGGLKDWEDNDDPWVEHAKWFSKCAYVLLKKGKSYVEKVTAPLQPKGSTSSCTEQPKDKVVDLESLVSKGEGSNESSLSSNCSSESRLSDGTLCRICYTNEMGVVFLPCGHLMACVDCALNMTTCGVCREPITRQLRTFIS